MVDYMIMEESPTFLTTSLHDDENDGEFLFEDWSHHPTGEENFDDFSSEDYSPSTIPEAPGKIEEFNSETAITDHAGTSKKMESFPPEKVSSFKHVIYNLLVDSHNSNSKFESVIFLVKVNHRGHPREGFQFNERVDYCKKFAELYALHVRKADLSKQAHAPVFIQVRCQRIVC